MFLFKLKSILEVDFQYECIYFGTLKFEVDFLNFCVYLQTKKYT